MASGYLRVDGIIQEQPEDDRIYRLGLTNFEVKKMFQKIVRGWFEEEGYEFGEFVASMFCGDLRSMNHYMNKVALNTFSYFDAGKKPSGQKEPKSAEDVAVIMEFKVFDTEDGETDLEDTAKRALRQIEEKNMRQTFYRGEFRRSGSINTASPSRGRSA